jgi:hypothetical protein
MQIFSLANDQEETIRVDDWGHPRRLGSHVHIVTRRLQLRWSSCIRHEATTVWLSIAAQWELMAQCTGNLFPFARWRGRGKQVLLLIGVGGMLKQIRSGDLETR